MRLALGLGLPFGGSSAAAFTPATLLPLGWWDPSDLTTLFQLSNGTTAVTANNNPVGYMGDKGSGANHLIQATSGDRPLYKTAGGLSWLESVSNDWLNVDRTLAQPNECISAWRILTLADGTSLMGGGAEGNFNNLYVGGGGTELRMYSGTELTGQAVPAQDADFVVTSRFNGVTSRIAVDSGSYTTASAGTGTALSKAVLAGAGGSQFIVARCYGIIEFDRLLTDPEIAQLRTYLAAKQGRVL